jgi:hypothetical protein
MIRSVKLRLAACAVAVAAAAVVLAGCGGDTVALDPVA